MKKKDMARHLIYLSYSKIPSPYANSLQVMHMCHAMADAGWKVDLFCLKTKVRQNAWEYYDLEANTVALHPVYMPRIKVLSRFLYGIRVIISLLSLPIHKAVLYGRDFYTLALLSLMKLSDNPIYLEAHQPPGDKLEAYLQKIIFSNTHFAGLVVISQALKEEYIHRFGTLLADKVVVSHDAARPRKAKSITATPLPPTDKLRVGYVGSLQSGKGMEIISRVASLLPDIEFHIVGGQADQIAQWSAKCADHVFFHGFQRSSQVPQFLQAFDIVLAPYLAEVKVGKKKVDIARWMSPLKLFEYMAAAKPIVASDLPVLQEVLVHGKNALLASPNHAEDWVAAIVKLQHDEDLRKALGTEAQKDFFQHYTWEHRAKQLIALFEKNSKLLSKTALT